jgi:glycosyltransferase involved in cell wall biosynthesis
MRFSVFTHVEHILDSGSIYAYSPYVREMNLWFSDVNEVVIVGPIVSKELSSIYLPYYHKKLILKSIPAINFLSIKSFTYAICKLPYIIYKIIIEMNNTDHIHIRCPGNIGLIASLIQIFYPNIPKTIKYAGNWDPHSKQPLSYKFQKWILNNTFLTRNAKVLVYGNWPNHSQNILSFFTASFSQNEQIAVDKKFTPPFKMIFVGSLVSGKNPFFAINLIESLLRKGVPVSLDYYGDGNLSKELQSYIDTRNLESFVNIMGNQGVEVLKEAYKKAHFLILASNSEGWPKAVAESMFYGCIPVATSVSCVPWMLGYGSRGLIINFDNSSPKVTCNKVINEISEKLLELIKSKEQLKQMSYACQEWSQQYTLEKFKLEIKKIL